jgi:Ca2+-binding EF-hand superfamily protein
MTTIQKLSVAAGVPALLALAALAGAAERGPPADTNKDGTIDFTEMQARQPGVTIEQFNAIDKDHNGQITREEMRAAGKERMEARAGERFKKLDANSDGGVTQAELDAARKQGEAERFKKLDTNGDGKLSQAEMEAGRKAMMGDRGDRRGPGESRGPGPHRDGPPPAGN